MGDGEPSVVVCENETNGRRLWGTDGGTPYPKDGIGDHVISGAATVNPDGTGTKGALWSYGTHLDTKDRAACTSPTAFAVS